MPWSAAVHLPSGRLQEVKLNLLDDYKENSGARRTILTFIVHRDHNKASRLSIWPQSDEESRR
jgi:hypothetical protein